MSLVHITVLALALLTLVTAYQYYRDRIPNGHTVPNPCGSGYWEPVGHYDPVHHTRAKNVFGKAFAAAGHHWTVALCQADSDGDGKTNGEELGDPGCTWTPGATPSGAATGQPGICEPVGSGACASSAFACGCTGHDCVVG